LREKEPSRVDHGVSAKSVKHLKQRETSTIEGYMGQRGHVASVENGRSQKLSTARSPNEQLFAKKRNQVVLFFTISAVAIGITSWLVLTSEPERAPTALTDVFNPSYASALENPATDNLGARIASLTANMEVLTGLITDLESKLIATDKLEVRIATLTENMGTLSSLTSDLEARQMEAKRLETRIASMTGNLQLLSSLTTDLESRQKAAQASVDSISRAEKRVVSSVKPELPKVAEKPRGIETQPASAASPVDPVPVTVALTSGQGPWTINLISSPDKAYAARFADRANSKGIRTAMQEVTVKGILYWRVQILGFSTKAEARAYSETAKEKLGLKDTWIM
tara:strand:+ start:1134 stop:2153 length:1020 start_codon:yes stop_codon:yes gene_type:complete